MKKFLFAAVLFLPALVPGRTPFAEPAYFDNTIPINRELFRYWSQKGIKYPARVSDSVFLRRVALTLAGRLPTAGEVRHFLADPDPAKRVAWIEKFLHDPRYAGMQAMRFADLLRIKSEFPINLWPNAVQLWHRTIKEELGKDRSLKAMFNEMLTASGSNFRTAHANFFRASADRTPRGLTAMVLYSCMGINAEKIPREMFDALVPLFSRIRYKSTYEWKEEIVYTDYLPADVSGCLPDGSKVSVKVPDQDPRQIFASWLLNSGEAYFCRVMTNRVWYWVFGSGIYPDVDDLPVEIAGSGKNVPFSPELQEFLNREFRESGYSLRHLYRIILNSAAFQASPAAESPAQIAAFAAYPVRRLEAEILIDALASVTGWYDKYMSVIPEPFTFLPANWRAVDIADGSISSGVLDSFGRPPRDSGKLSERNKASSEAQKLYLMNSVTLFQRTRSYCQRIRRKYRRDEACLEQIYLEILSRKPTEYEHKAFAAYVRTLPVKERRHALQDTVWVLFNSKEFLFHH